ncbi:FtsL-like putative cell division protein [Persicobacter psychrovividus]|uniref:Uncharacterized protein n=1 Tax=Persicobacter psychrovividus TaxID=387638 RepID=A0ABM7VEZ1_9BACT|nr:hypothetical protein PEPS_17030 [Persicobacter psychrovividus]
MAENTLRKPKPSPPKVTTKKQKQKKKKKGLWNAIEDSFKQSYLGRNGIDLQLLKPWVLFLLLGVIYIFNSHYTEKTSRKIDKLKQEVLDLRSRYTTMKYSYMYDSKQSEVAKRVKPLGLEESEVPPYKIVIKEQ